MNASVYLFGEFNSGYSQYPNDYASSIFQKFSANAKSTTQIAIHRDGNLMYYGYIRKLQQERHIGLCVVLNGIILKRIDGLFSLFENIISNLVTNGRLIHFNEQGELVTSVEKLYLNKEEIELLTETLRAGFNRFESCSASLPAVSYGTSKESCRNFVVDDDCDEIFNSSYTNGYTYIYKSNGYNTAQLDSYKGVLNKTYKEKQELQTRLEKLEKEHEKTLKQKKQFKIVIILFIILLGCAIGLFALNDNLNLTRSELSGANETITMQSGMLDDKNMEISILSSNNDELEIRLRSEEEKVQTEISKRTKAEEELESFKRTISDRQPFIIESTSFNFSTGYLAFDYYGVTEGTTPLKIRAYNDDGESYINSSSIYINKGHNSVSIYLSRDLSSSRWYSFEILKDNRILGGDRH